VRRRVAAILPATLIYALVQSVSAGEREDYLVCVTQEVGAGTDLAEIGTACLEKVRPDANDEPEQDEYPYEKALRAALDAEGSFFDPESARFKDLVFNRRFNAWCGRINAKNRLGGYVGWEYFALQNRYRGYGNERDHVELTLGPAPRVEPECKRYQAWVRENW